MANWDSNVKHEPSEINAGNRYEKKDRLSREQLNAITENSFYAVSKSDEALEKADSAFTGNGTIARVGGVSKAFLDFDSDPQEQLNKTEKTEVIYDMDGGSSLDWEMSGGLRNDYSKVIDTSEYERLLCTYVYSSNVATFIVDLTKQGETKGMGIGGIGYDSYGTNLGFFTGEVSVSADRQSLSVKIFNAFQAGYYDSYGCISKIIGVSK